MEKFKFQYIADGFFVDVVEDSDTEALTITLRNKRGEEVHKTTCRKEDLFNVLDGFQDW